MEKQKFQFESDEQATKFYADTVGFPIDREDINRLKVMGYIRKSELRTLVEEAEEMFKTKSWNTEDNVPEWDDYAPIELDKLYILIQALKKSHPEFKE